MSSLAANPSGSAGVYGQPGQQQSGDTLAIVNNIKDREMRDYQNKANFMADLSIKQDRLRKLYGLDGSGQQQMQQPQPQQSQDGGSSSLYAAMDRANKVQQQSSQNDPNNPMSPQNQYATSMKQKQQGLDTESQRVNQQGKMGQEALDIKTQQEKLNETKNQNIHDQKQKDSEDKLNEANQRLQLAQAEIDRKTKAGEDSTQAHKDAMQAATDAHEAEKVRMQANFDKTLEQHQQVIDNNKAKNTAGQNKTTTTSVNSDGTQKTVNTRSGSAAQNVLGINSDGSLHVGGGPKSGPNSHPNGEYDIPTNQLDHWNSLYGQPSQSDQSQQGDTNASQGNKD